MKDNKKPEFLYHGSPNGEFAVFEPRKANGVGRVEDQYEAFILQC